MEFQAAKKPNLRFRSSIKILLVRWPSLKAQKIMGTINWKATVMTRSLIHVQIVFHCHIQMSKLKISKPAVRHLTASMRLNLFYIKKMSLFICDFKTAWVIKTDLRCITREVQRLNHQKQNYKLKNNTVLCQVLYRSLKGLMANIVRICIKFQAL